MLRGGEVRKVEVFSDGSLGYADRSTSVGTTFLGLIPLPTPSQIASMPEFEPVAITREEFEVMWLRATAQTSEA
jgi:hypothetical protein